jgi:hypothetical protein
MERRGFTMEQVIGNTKVVDAMLLPTETVEKDDFESRVSSS